MTRQGEVDMVVVGLEMESANVKPETNDNNCRASHEMPLPPLGHEVQDVGR
ncbi:MAG: hypothetical protein LBI87_06565 [Candidatus Accumulibacter sp.]|jgi:hypothetical protein|nr:hypothetical protein [Accumulibacter sp.]